MKLRTINKIIAFTSVTFLTLTSCKKDDGAIPNNIEIEKIPAVSMNTATGGVTGSISLATAGAFTGNFKASLYFAGSEAPTKIDISIRKNASSSPVNNSNVKIFKTNITSLPAEFTITAAELEALFGAPLKVKEVYDFGPDLYVNGKKYEAFPASSLGSGAGVNGMSAVGFGEYVRYTVVN
jgi:hypothetical protein